MNRGPACGRPLLLHFEAFLRLKSPDKPRISQGRVLVHGGYDGDRSQWLAGGRGYAGTIRKLTATAAAIELDEELKLHAVRGQQWQDFGADSASALREVTVARGRWLTLIHGWVGQTWADPIRLHVGLCEVEPDVYAIPEGGGIGYWVNLTPTSH